jgi:hypothetical protein
MSRVQAERRLGLVASLALVGALVGCSGGHDGEPETSGAAAISDAPPTDEGVVYFHGMSHLGFAKPAIQAQIGGDDLLAPSLTDAQIEAAPSSDVLAFLPRHQRATVSGYSLGRVPVLKMMKTAARGMTRVVMIDPTYDSASGLGKGISGGIAKSWLDGGDDRRFFLVYGDTTKQLGGDTSYTTALDGDPHAVLCYVPGDHTRFRQPDVAYALVASDCDDLKSHLGTQAAENDSGDDDDASDSATASARRALDDIAP